MCLLGNGPWLLKMCLKCTVSAFPRGDACSDIEKTVLGRWRAGNGDSMKDNNRGRGEFGRVLV